MTNHDKKELQKLWRNGRRDPRCIPGWRAIGKQGERVEHKQRAAQNRPPGPGRPAPMHYAGETFGPHVVQYPDVERYPNGALPSIRSKPMRRIVRGALKRKFSKVEQGRKLIHGMTAQAYEIARDEKASGRYARRLLAKELKIHQSVYAPDGKTLRKIRTEKRARLRRGEPADAISALVNKLAGEKR